MTEKMMTYLGNAEGTKIHYNSSETDITTMYGIYKAAHPQASIFNLIDLIARNAGISNESSKWTHSDINTLNNYIIDNNLNESLEHEAREFYDEFLKRLHLDKFPEEAQIAAFSLYTNSPKKGIMSVQSAINKFITNGFITNPILTVDGALGTKSASALDKIEDGYLFEAYMLLEMSKQYSKLAVANSDKYLRYLNGWNNRLDSLAKI